MELLLKRKPGYEGSPVSIGELTINGNPFKCFTLEDTDRGLVSTMSKAQADSIKIKGRTAIPKGRYKIVMNVVSPRFSKVATYNSIGGKLPRLVDVLAYEGVLIHIGNKAEDTDGCILVGDTISGHQVLNSKVTFFKLYDILEKASQRGEEIWITIA